MENYGPEGSRLNFNTHESTSNLFLKTTYLTKPNKQDRMDDALKEGLTMNIPHMYTIFPYFENISKSSDSKKLRQQ